MSSITDVAKANMNNVQEIVDNAANLNQLAENLDNLIVQFKGGKSAFAKGVTPAVIDSSQAFEFLFSGSSDAGIAIGATANPNSTGFLSFRRSTTTQIGSIYRNGTSDAVVYSTSSDYRLKENIGSITDGITRVKQLQPRRFSWKNDSDSTMQDGFIAHEVATVVPSVVKGSKDEVVVWQKGEELPDGVSLGDNKLDDDGNTIPEYQGIEYGKLVPLLATALQEAIAKIETLETKVAALEG